MPELTIRSSFAQAIFRCLRKFRLSRVLEIGSFDGDGSTQVLISAIKNLPGRHLDCLEFRPERFANLVKHTRNYSWVHPYQLTSISYQSFSKIDFEKDIMPFYANKSVSEIERVKSWWDSDIEQMKAFGTGFLESHPLRYDAVLIDGGEFSAYDEFRLLRAHVNCFMLDDTVCFKCNEVRRELESDPAWKMIFDDTKERNGSAIFVRQNLISGGLVQHYRDLLAYIQLKLALILDHRSWS